MAQELTATQPLKKKRKREVTELQRRARAGKLFISPFIVGFLCFYLQPLIMSLYFSFTQAKSGVGGGLQYSPASLESYIRLFTKDSTYWQKFADAFINMAETTPVILVFSLFLAVLLNQNFKGRMLARAVFFMPVVVTSGIVISLIRGDHYSSKIDISSESSSSGAIFEASGMSDILTSMNLPDKIVDLFTAIIEQTFDTLWQCGVQILLFLAALQGVPPQLYEAAKIEGATGWETFWKVTFPNVTPIIIVNLVYSIVDAITSSGSEIMSLIGTTFNDGDYGYAAAMSWMFFLALFLVLGIIFIIVNKRVFYQNN